VSVETSVVIPTLDDAATLGETVERLNRHLAATSAAAEVLIVDAGSTDGTLEIAGELADRFPLLHMRVLVQDRRQAGFGDLLRLGVAYASGRFCVVVMPDARDPLELVPKMLTELRGGAHLVLCSRYEADGGRPRNLPWRFRAYQSIYRRAVRLALGADVPDSTYGFRAFNRTFVQALGLTGHRMSVCSEITFKVLLAGGVTKRLLGAPTGPMLSQQSKFRLGNELAGYAFMLGRAGLHRAGLRWV
jgi:glycosyltransferase involved in cell wall biosynthesis